MNESNLLDQSEALFRAIGLTVVRFQQVEQWLAEELAVLLHMRDKEDQYVVSAAMSFGQKVDLLVELFPKRAIRHPRLPFVDIKVVQKALSKAEEYRNRVVHSFYAIECTDESRWHRMKGSLRGRKGFSLNSTIINIGIFEECNEALRIIREWSIKDSEAISAATATLMKHIQENTM